MGRKKVDKSSIEYMSKNLFHKDTTSGFQFTAGNTPLGIKENRPMDMSCSLNQERSVVIDLSKGDLEKLITKEIFGTEKYIVDLAKIRDLQEQFKALGYEVEEADFVGIWYWFRIKCTAEEIPLHVEILKNNLKK